MEVLNLTEIKSGSLVSQIRDETVVFRHNGKECSVNIRIKQLPFVETESLFLRWGNKENVASEWISKALVDDKGKTMFTQTQVENTFVQALANAVFEMIWNADNVKKPEAKAKSKAAS
ncbi:MULTISPECIES: phage tail assembly chaperone family protein, TAC [Psychrobacter]|uniref:Phage tail assembly chaperone family protein, TAC n=1 Tax=Psychrobacter faecalis TaxID=180588 RepID=A0ABT9HEC1_9GAMM|nr:MULTISPECIES: phage tail assembly chaperone family protein, TAC [Psychrobacter]MBK3393745.1 phage tail assembly chaperone family protein, TAC [Psychrobacter sp. M9-54-1]MDP4544113.1 phage tail assembly chaperone family protein, TAC [Psychrobacter faecalis]